MFLLSENILLWIIFNGFEQIFYLEDVQVHFSFFLMPYFVFVNFFFFYKFNLFCTISSFKFVNALVMVIKNNDKKIWCIGVFRIGNRKRNNKTEKWVSSLSVKRLYRSSCRRRRLYLPSQRAGSLIAFYFCFVSLACLLCLAALSSVFTSRSHPFRIIIALSPSHSLYVLLDRQDMNYSSISFFFFLFWLRPFFLFFFFSVFIRN